MSKRVQIALAVLLVAALAWLAMCPREPVYNGSPLSVWLVQLDQEMPNGNYVGTNGPAATAIQQIGTNAIPFLRELLHARDSGLKTKLIDLSSKQRLMKFHVARANDWRRRAAFATFCLGPSGSPLMPEIMRLFRDSNYEAAFTVARVVGCIGYCSPETLPALIAALEDGSPGVRARAAFAVCQLNSCFMIVDGNELPNGGFPERCKAAVPSLFKALNDTDSEVRRVAAMALQQIDSGAATKAGVK